MPCGAVYPWTYVGTEEVPGLLAVPSMSPDLGDDGEVSVCPVMRCAEADACTEFG